MEIMIYIRICNIIFVSKMNVSNINLEISKYFGKDLLPQRLLRFFRFMTWIVFVESIIKNEVFSEKNCKEEMMEEKDREERGKKNSRLCSSSSSLFEGGCA
jgi:hypothetical protein